MDRRSFVFLSSGAALGNMMVPGLDDPEHCHAHESKHSHSSTELILFNSNSELTGRKVACNRQTQTT